MDTTGNKLLKQLVLDLADKKKETLEQQEVDKLKKRVRWLTALSIGLLIVVAGEASHISKIKPKKVNYNYMQTPCPDNITSSMNGRSYCIIT